MIDRLVIIPARGNSKRIRNKNIKKFNGKPIINYSIKNLEKSKLFKKIHISTESKKITNKINKKYIDFLRPKALSGDKVSTLSVMQYVVNKYIEKGIFFNEIWCLSACSPLVIVKDLIQASSLLKKNGKKIIITVSAFHTPIEWGFKMKKNKELDPILKGAYKKNSQNFKTKYFDTGDFICMKYKLFKNINNKTSLDKMYVGLEIPKYRAVDIDEFEDWKIAELYHRILKI